MLDFSFGKIALEAGLDRHRGADGTALGLIAHDEGRDGWSWRGRMVGWVEPEGVGWRAILPDAVRGTPI